MADLTPEHASRRMDGDLHPEVRAAYKYVESVIPTADAQSPVGGYAWHGWSLREAFLAGCTHARTQLAQSEPKKSKPVVDYSRVPEIATEAQIRSAAQYLVKKRNCDGDLIPAIKYAIARWGRSTPQPEGEELTDEKLLRMAATEIGYEFTGSWFLTGRNSPNLEVTPLELLNLMRAVLARWGRPAPQPPASCPACEGAPSPSNSPCAVCGTKATLPPLSDGEGLTDEELLGLMPQQFRDDLATVSRLASYGTPVEPGIYRVSLNTGALDFARTAIAADRARRPTPQPELTHHITPDDFRRWWRETGSASPAPSPEMMLTANAWAQYCLDRWGRPTPQPPADGEVEDLVKRLKSVKRNDNSIPSSVHWGLSDGTIHHHRIHVTSNHASDCDRAAELLQRFASPAYVAVNPSPEAVAALKATGPGRIELLPDGTQIIEPAEHTLLVPVLQPVAIPGEEYHEDMGPVTWWRLPVEEPPWVGTPNDSDWPGYHTHFTPAPPTPCNAHALPFPTESND